MRTMKRMDRDFYFRIAGEKEILKDGKAAKLAKRAQQGDQIARNELTVANLRLVIVIAIQYRKKYPRLSFFDLIQEGNEGLLRAVEAEGFDDKLGKFSAYAASAINRSIKRFADNQIRGMVPSLDVPIPGKSERFRRDLVPAKEEPNSVEAIEYLLFTTGKVNDALEKLKGRERDVITMRYGLNGKEPLTLEEVGHQLGITKQGTQLIQAKAVEKLQRTLKEFIE